jgi:hypothetical protein
MSDKNKRPKKLQEAQSDYLNDFFHNRNQDTELIEVVLQRADWEALHYSIGLALETNPRPKKKK